MQTPLTKPGPDYNQPPKTCFFYNCVLTNNEPSHFADPCRIHLISNKVMKPAKIDEEKTEDNFKPYSYLAL